MWRCASASRRERATVYELRIHHAALVFGRSIEPRARRAPGAVPGHSKATFPGPAARAARIAVKYRIAVRSCVRSGYPGAPARANWGIGPHGSHTRRTPPPDPSGSRPPRAPLTGPVWSHTRQATAPPRRYNFSLLGDGVRRRPTLPVPRCDTGHPAQRAQGARTRLQLGGGQAFFIFVISAGPAPRSRDARATITHSGHTFTLDSALKPLSHPPETLSLALNSSTQPLILTHTHPLTLTHSLKRTHSLTHTHPLTLTHWRYVSMRTSLGVVERVA